MSPATPQAYRPGAPPDSDICPNSRWDKRAERTIARLLDHADLLTGLHHFACALIALHVLTSDTGL
jgi:hypothetical protein